VTDPEDDGGGGSPRPDGSGRSERGAEAVRLVRSYYDAIDAGEYDRLRGLLDEGFVQRRPDRTFEGAAAFVGFMRSGRPRTDTTHRLDEVYLRSSVGAAGGGSGPAGESSDGPTDDGGSAGDEGPAGDTGGVDDAPTMAAARGSLWGADGERLFRFVDVFAVEEGSIRALETFTR